MSCGRPCLDENPSNNFLFFIFAWKETGRCTICYNDTRETIAVDGSSSREEVIAMYITLPDLLSVGTFLVSLITLILQIKR